MAKPLLNCLLLRGMIREQRHWGDFPAVLAEKVPNLRLFYLDHIGIGTEARRDPPWSLEEMSEDLRHRWKKIQSENPGEWSLFSLSLGSMVAMDWVQRHPGDFSHLAIMNTSASNTSPPWKRLRLGSLKTFLKIALTAGPYAKELQILDMTTSLLKDKEKLAREWGEIQLPYYRMKKLALAHLICASRFRAPRELHVALSVFMGAKDSLISPDCTLDLAKHFNVLPIIHPEAGHDICLDDPLWVAEKLKEVWAL